MPRLIKIGLWSLVGLLLLVAAAGGAGFLWLKGSLPPLEGRLALSGLGAPVEVLRDGDGVVTIRAQSEADAYQALGYVHAQDRLWQMDFMRRTGAGRLSEVVGERTLEIDRLMRGLDLYGLAEASLDQLSPEARAALDAYCAGVNAYISAPTGPWPPGFQLLRNVPEPWRPADSMVWARLMTLQLSGNWHREVQRLKLKGRLPAQAIAFLWPQAPADSPVTVHAALGPLDPGPDPSQVLPWDWAPKIASNFWAIDGERSDSDKPILANDPHLALSAPGLWYLARIETPELTLAGATSPGVPFHILGHNGQVAWGLTTTHADTQDLFIEKLAHGRPSHYETPEGVRPFTLRRDFIEIRGREPERVTYRSTRHGPVVGDLQAKQPEGLAEDQVLALAWPGLRPDDRTGEALYRMNHARSAAQFAEALESFDAPVQNVGYADVRGTIGFQTVGRVPIRKNGDGFAPVPGWSGAFDWSGWIPAAELPSVTDPAKGVVVNANNRVVGPSYPYLLTARWPDPARAERIEELLGDLPKSDIAGHERLQNDSLSLGAARLLPRLLSAPQSDPAGREAHALLGAWDKVMDRERPEPLIFAAWLDNLTRRLLTPRLGSLFPAFDRPNLPLILQILETRPLWCDDPKTPQEESCDDQIESAFTGALSDLEKRFGGTMSDWRWGDAHQARFAHPLFSHLPLYESLFGFSVATDGGGDTINRAVPRFGEPLDKRFTDVHGPGYRAIYDLADLDASRFIIATGQSGNPLSPFYGNLAQRWSDGHYVKLVGDDKDAPYRLLLNPG
ncbi:MAG: penicillin acylase family protein [Pseudomonadota bacterium]